MTEVPLSKCAGDLAALPGAPEVREFVGGGGQCAGLAGVAAAPRPLDAAGPDAAVVDHRLNHGREWKPAGGGPLAS